MNDLRKSNFNKLYVGFIIAISTAFLLDRSMLALLIVTGIIIAVAEIVKVHTDKAELQHNIWKFQIFLLIIVLIPIAISFFESAKVQISSLKLSKPQPGVVPGSKNLPKGISPWRLAFDNFLPPSIELIGIIIAYLGLGKYSADTKSSELQSR